MKKRNKVLLTGATLLTIGGVTGYAATNIFANLEAIQENFDTVFNFAESQKKKADRLQNELNKESGNKEQLQKEIDDLKAEIEEIEMDHMIAIMDKKAEIKKKQDEIEAKQKIVAEKEARIDELDNQIAVKQGELAQVEAKVNELLDYTNDKTSELTGEE